MGSWVVGYLNGATGSPAASFMFMALSLLVSVVLTLMVKPASQTAEAVPAPMNAALASK